MLFNKGKHFCKNFKDSKLKNSPALSYFQNVLIDEQKRIETVKMRDLLSTSENPLSKLQNELKEISKELNAINRERIVELSRRRQLLNNSHDLRLLHKDLRSAWVANDIIKQKYENAKSIEDGRKRKEQEMIEWRLMHQKAMESLAREQEEERQKKFKLMNALKKQISELQQRRKEEKQINLKEREEMQRKLNSMESEDQAKKEHSKKICLKLKHEMEKSVSEVMEKKRLSKIEHMNYMEQLQIYQKKKDENNAKLEGERRRIRIERQKLSESIGNYLLKLHKESEERSDFLTDLLTEERNTKENEAVRRKIAKHNEARLALHKDLEFFHNVIKPQKEAQLREQNRLASIKRQMYLDELDRSMKIKADKEQRKKLEYGAILKNLMDTKRQEILKEKAQVQKEEEMLIAAEREQDHIIDLEAIRILKSQPPEILQFVSTKLLKPSYLSELKTNNSPTI